MNWFKRFFKTESKVDLNQFLKIHGPVKTTKTLMSFSQETLVFLEANREYIEGKNMFEENLFCFSYFLNYIKHDGDREALQREVLIVFTLLLDKVLDPIEESFFTLLKNSKEKFILEKIKMYQTEIKKIQDQQGYVSKIIFASLFVYPTFNAKESINRAYLIKDEIAIPYQLNINAAISLLDSICEKISTYIKD